MIEYLIVFLISYLIGSIPFSYLIPKFYGIDIRKIGSGNVGATNVYRALGLLPALASGLLDMSKAYISCYIAEILYTNAQSLFILISIAGIGTLLGHVFSIFMKFKSGKGVSTFLGYLLFIDPKIALILIAMSSVGIAETKIVSINSISSVIWAPMLATIFNDNKIYVLSLIIFGIIVIYTHIPNIERLVRGNELSMVKR